MRKPLTLDEVFDSIVEFPDLFVWNVISLDGVEGPKTSITKHTEMAKFVDDHAKRKVVSFEISLVAKYLYITLGE